MSVNSTQQSITQNLSLFISIVFVHTLLQMNSRTQKKSIYYPNPKSAKQDWEKVKESNVSYKPFCFFFFSLLFDLKINNFIVTVIFSTFSFQNRKLPISTRNKSSKKGKRKNCDRIGFEIIEKQTSVKIKSVCLVYKLRSGNPIFPFFAVGCCVYLKTYDFAFG